MMVQMATATRSGDGCNEMDGQGSGVEWLACHGEETSGNRTHVMGRKHSLDWLRHCLLLADHVSQDLSPRDGPPISNHQKTRRLRAEAGSVRPSAITAPCVLMLCTR